MVDRVDVNSVLMQMRQVKNQLRSQQELAVNQSAQAANTGVAPGANIGGFNPNTNPTALNPNSLTTDGVAPSRFQAQLAQQLESVTATEAVNPTAKMDETVPDFQTMFANGINAVNDNQKAAKELATRFEQGDPTVDLPDVMIAMQKSSVSFQAMTQVRNKLVEAYKDVMNMPL